jgi:hypothetical protein
VYSISLGETVLMLTFFFYLLTNHLYSMISYPNYKFYWPIRALGLYSKKFGNAELV